MERILAISYTDSILQSLEASGWEIRIYDVSNEFGQFIYYAIDATCSGYVVSATGRTLARTAQALEDRILDDMNRR